MGLRQRADETADEVGSRIDPLGAAPVPVSPQITQRARYLKMAERFALTAAEQLTCGCHVHVSVDATLIAALARGLVETASREWKAGRSPRDMPTELLRVATWRAGRSGIEGELVHPRTGRPAAAADVVSELLGHVSGALSEAGDWSVVEVLMAQPMGRGNGALAQRETFARMNDLSAVVLEAVADRAGVKRAFGSVPGTRPVQGR